MATGNSTKEWVASQLWPLGLFGLSLMLFLLEPKLDLTLTGQFFDGTGFPLDSNTVVHLIYLVFAKIHIIFLIALPAMAIYQHNKRDQHTEARTRRSRYLFLWLTLLIGPGLITHVGLKDNSFGRPRPRDVTEFMGTKHYAEPLQVSDECPKNCSFVSGHAAIGFWFLTFAWTSDRRRWLVVGVATGIVVGATRIVQGAHFLSDVVFAFWVVWFTNALMAPWFGLPNNPLQVQMRNPPSTSKVRPEI